MDQEEASPELTRKRKPDYVPGHDLLNLAAENKKSQVIKSFVFPQIMQKSSRGTQSQDLLRDLKNNEISQDSRSIKPAHVEQSKEERGGGIDLIIGLPDDVLGNIISRLSTKEGARTQTLATRWQPLWRSSPLNLQIDCGLSSKERTRISLINKILSTHKGGGRRLYLHQVSFNSLRDNSNRWLQSAALNNLHELDFCYRSAHSDLGKPLPSSVLRFASTLGILSLGNCHFPVDTSHSLEFPKLKQLSLECVTISENDLQCLLSGCPALESLLLLDCDGLRLVCITSASIRSIGVRSTSGMKVDVEPDIILQELVIRDTPCLERLLTFPPKSPTIIQVTGAPKLEVLGYLSTSNTGKIEIGSMLFKNMVTVGSTASMCRLKVLVLISTDPDLGAVLNLLKCFPCLETLYIMHSVPRINILQYPCNPHEPIHCIGHHLKKIIIRGYKGDQSDIDFANFFVINARRLQKMTIGVPIKCSDKWMANQHGKLQLDNKASQDARFEIMQYYLLTDMDCQKRTHDLSVLDPFET